MPKYWMINDRSQGGVGPDVNFDGVTYWVSDKQLLTDIKNWRQVTSLNFRSFWSRRRISFLRMTRQRTRNKVTSRFSFMVLIKRLQRPLDFIRTFVGDFLTVPRASASAFFTTGHRAAAPSVMSLIVRMRACALKT